MLFRKTRGLRLLSFLGVLLSRQDRVYLLSLLIPFAIYNLAFGGEQERPRFIAGAS